MVEVIAQRVAGIGYGDTITLLYNPDAIAIEPPPTTPRDAGTP
jgi:hypothetical protein